MPIVSSYFQTLGHYIYIYTASTATPRKIKQITREMQRPLLDIWRQNKPIKRGAIGNNKRPKHLLLSISNTVCDATAVKVYAMPVIHKDIKGIMQFTKMDFTCCLTFIFRLSPRCMGAGTHTLNKKCLMLAMLQIPSKDITYISLPLVNLSI